MSVITFKPNDHTKITTDFERYEFACPCGCTAQMIDPELVQKMQTIRTKLGKAIKVTSGYRCVKHNADPKVGGSRTSRHLYGIAADWRTNDRSINPVALGIIAAAQGFGAVGIYWHDKAAIVHTDTRGGKATWLCVQPGVYSPNLRALSLSPRNLPARRRQPHSARRLPARRTGHPQRQGAGWRRRAGGSFSFFPFCGHLPVFVKEICTTQAERLKNERESSVAGGVDHLETGHLP